MACGDLACAQNNGLPRIRSNDIVSAFLVFLMRVNAFIDFVATLISAAA
jgi:hypothetical protein